ncbi:MAG: ABC transporter ATP-binding protein [Blastocatellia bacterium]
MIRVDNLSKRYRIGAQQAAYSTFRESLVDAVRAPFKRLRGNGHSQQHTIWALKDLSFTVKPGEVVGVIGRNGAGKSTLLKVLSRITEPTTGGIDLYGRVASLLEVGTGFHPELTGRENIYLNGAILGMGKAEIKRKFDEMVAFAEVEKFLDTPVKHYSSGMYVRLAFAVAAHMESEILLVDEVLAVGDAEFQKRCLGKMEEVGSQGRTVLFVSHNMPMILRLCSRVVMLGQGKLVADGTPHEVTREYLHSEGGSPAERVWPNRNEAPGNDVARLAAVRVIDDQGAVAEVVDIRKPVSIEVEYWNLQNSLRPTVSMHFLNEDGVTLFCTNDWSNREWWNTSRRPGLVRANCKVPGNFLAEGRVFLLVAVCSYNPDVVHAIEHDAVSFQVVERGEAESVRGVYAPAWPGVVRPMLEWQVGEATE